MTCPQAHSEEAVRSQISRLSKQIHLPDFLSLMSPKVSRVKKGSQQFPLTALTLLSSFRQSRCPCATAHTPFYPGCQVSSLTGFPGSWMRPSSVCPHHVFGSFSGGPFKNANIPEKGNTL